MIDCVFCVSCFVLVSLFFDPEIKKFYFILTQNFDRLWGAVSGVGMYQVAVTESD
jgi:hypothetical protein